MLPRESAQVSPGEATCFLARMLGDGVGLVGVERAGFDVHGFGGGLGRLMMIGGAAVMAGNPRGEARSDPFGSVDADACFLVDARRGHLRQ